MPNNLVFLSRKSPQKKKVHTVQGIKRDKLFCVCIIDMSKNVFLRSTFVFRLHFRVCTFYSSREGIRGKDNKLCQTGGRYSIIVSEIPLEH